MDDFRDLCKGGSDYRMRGLAKSYIGEGRCVTTGGRIPVNSGTVLLVISKGHAMSVEHRNRFQGPWRGSRGQYGDRRSMDGYYSKRVRREGNLVGPRIPT